MTWTYDPTQLAASNLMQVRLLVRDTNAGDPLIQDEEIDWFIASEGTNPYRAAWRAAEDISANFARSSDKRLGPLHDSGSQKSKQYHALAYDLKQKWLRNAVMPKATALSLADKRAVESDTDRVPPSFTREQFIIPGTEEEIVLIPQGENT